MKKRYTTGILVLLVFAAFMISVLMILLTGANLVQGITQRDQRSHDQRTIVQYLTTRVRQADRAGAVSITSSGALVLREEFTGTDYETIIYAHEGYLREMFCEAGYSLAPEFGEEILPVTDFRASYGNQILSLTFEMPDGTEGSVNLRLRSEQEVQQ